MLGKGSSQKKKRKEKLVRIFSRFQLCFATESQATILLYEFGKFRMFAQFLENVCRVTAGARTQKNVDPQILEKNYLSDLCKCEI